MLKAIAASLTFLLLTAEIPAQTFISGADLSYVNTILEKGGVYRDASGNVTDPYRLFADKGASMVRIRLWHTPQNITDKCGNPIEANDLDDVVLAFQRAKSNGMKRMLAIHYGDYFNDPDKQKMPAAWMGLSHSVLIDSVHRYTSAVLARLLAENVVPDVVAIGNETTWEFIDETASTQGWTWPEDADKFNAGFDAVDEFNAANGQQVKKAVHFTQSTALWLAGLFKSQQITNFDILGFSFYPMWADISTMQALGNLIQQLKTVSGKEIMVFETGAPWTLQNSDTYSNFMNNYGDFSYPVNAQGQKDFLYDLAETVYENGGTGIIYWEPAWITSSMCDAWGRGSSYENVGFFDFNNNNTPLPAFDFFGYCRYLSVESHPSGSGSVRIYPNPAKSHCSILGLLQPTQIIITDSKGNILRREVVQDSLIDLSGLPDGVYYLTLRQDGKSITRQLVKQSN